MDEAKRITTALNNLRVVAPVPVLQKASKLNAAILALTQATTVPLAKPPLIAEAGKAMEDSTNAVRAELGLDPYTAADAENARKSYMETLTKQMNDYIKETQDDARRFGFLEPGAVPITTIKAGDLTEGGCPTGEPTGYQGHTCRSGLSSARSKAHVRGATAVGGGALHASVEMAGAQHFHTDSGRVRRLHPRGRWRRGEQLAGATRTGEAPPRSPATWLICLGGRRIRRFPASSSGRINRETRYRTMDALDSPYSAASRDMVNRRFGWGHRWCGESLHQFVLSVFVFDWPVPQGESDTNKPLRG